MIRKPLRPLAAVFSARAAGQNPDEIEAANTKERALALQESLLTTTRRRLWLLTGMFLFAYVLIAVQMVSLSVSDPVEPRARATGSPILASRADIIDRNGRVLATNIDTFSVYAHPQQIIDKPFAAQRLAEIFPDLEGPKLLERFNGSQKFMWIKGHISPEEKQAVHDIGDPGLLFGPREMRLYPNEAIAAHVLGGATFGEQGTHSAEVVGVAGVEKSFDEFLRDPAHSGKPLQLSLDLTVQAALEDVLYGGMNIMNAKGASAVLMDANTGEIVALSSIPDFDPNKRPQVLTEGAQDDSPLFNRAIQGMYELGSALKIFTVAQALELNLVNSNTKIDTRGPLRWGRHKIKDFSNYGPSLSTKKVIVKSSNIGTARIAMMIGGKRQKAFLEELGFLTHTPIETIEGPTGRPQFPKTWSEISTMTISYGHGISTSPVHLAAAYASVTNGGTLVRPTLIKQTDYQRGPRVVSEQVSMQVRDMLRAVVTEGTASFGEVPGYAVGGKTGTADKPKPSGGYYDDKVIATFASIFPSHDPKYVLILSLDEPEDRTGPKVRRTAGWTAVPVAAEAIRRVAPLLGVAPDVDPSAKGGVTLASH